MVSAGAIKNLGLGLYKAVVFFFTVAFGAVVALQLDRLVEQTGMSPGVRRTLAVVVDGGTLLLFVVMVALFATLDRWSRFTREVIVKSFEAFAGGFVGAVLGLRLVRQGDAFLAELVVKAASTAPGFFVFAVVIFVCYFIIWMFRG